MRREHLRSMALRGLILGLFWATAGLSVAASPPASLKAVVLDKPATGEELVLRIEGDYAFKAFQSSADTVLIDLMGVEAEDVPARGAWAGGLLSGYSLLQYNNAARVPVTHLRVTLNHRSPFHAEQTPQGLRLAFGGEPSAAPIAATPSQEPDVRASVPASTEIHKVAITEDENGQTLVDVVATGQPNYRVFKLENPPRLVLDFQGAHRASRVRTYHSQSALLSDVRVAQFRTKDPAVVRVVADLAGDPQYDVQPVAEGVRIALRSRTSGEQSPAAPANTQSQLAKAPTPTIPSEAESVHASPAAQEPSNEHASQAAPASTSVVDALPGSTQAVSAAPKQEFIGETSESEASKSAAKIIAGSTFAVSATPGQAPAGAAAAASEQPQYTGEPISLNLKDVDLKDFFRLIHEISGLNIIIDPNVSGNVTMVLDNVPWDQALDIVLKNNQLGKTLEGNVLRIAKLSTLSSEQSEAVKLAAAREDAQPLVTKFVAINYAKASQIATMLKSWVGGGALTKRGNVLVDDRTNTLIISDIASQIPIIVPIIEKLDTKTKQIAIEARIERVTSDFQRTLSNALTAGLINKAGQTQQAAATGSASGITTSTDPTTTPPYAITATQASGTGFGVYAISNIGARYIINDVLAAAESTDNAKTISKPSIVTQNNVPGKVMQGTQIPIQTSINNTITITYVNAALQLTVTPQVTSDGNVFLDIKVENSTPGPALTGVNPSINTQSATTQVLVPDGGTVIFGGVTVNQTTNSEAYVPLLGKIPVIGNLFKSSIKTRSDAQLLFFVSPKILPG
jgi:type IV pilus assembly protein PilQ